jgi:glycosyltransferase involved in cell wall biosynthesis
MTRKLYIFDHGLKGLGGHYYEYVRSIVEAARAVGIRCIVACHEQAGDGSFASFELHPVFRDDVWASLEGEDYHAATSMNGVSARFLEDVNKVVAKHPVRPGDMIFLPNIAKPHVVAAALVAETFGPEGVRAHFMFRYPASHFTGETAAAAFRRLEVAAGKYEVSLCTDSHRLADNLASLTSLPFAVFPIPHTWRGQAHAGEVGDLDRPLHCVSLGNARDEKGIAEILEAVRLSSREPWAEKVRFTLQVNDPYQVEKAIDAFRKGPPDPRTTLIDESLGSAAYAALLESADVVLVPYWRSIYRERTSGVFLEGLITGKLVLCTRDTWMSDLFDIHGGGVAIEDRSSRSICDGLRELVEQRKALQVRARHAAKYWQAVHCPENLIAHLAGGNAQPVLGLGRRGKAAVLFPWGEAVSGKTGAALRLKYFVRYMESIYGEVRILFAGGGESGGVIGKKSVAQPYHYSDESKQLHEQLKAVCKTVGASEEDCFHLWFHLWPDSDPIFALRCEEMVLWADHIYVDYTYFVPLVDRLCRQHGKDYTVTIHDIVSEQASRTPFLHSASRTLEFEAARKAPRLICASEADRVVLAAGGIEAEIIPHSIDAHEATSPFSPDEARAILRDLFDLPVMGRRLCFFVGSYYPPNVEAAETIAEMARRCWDDPRLHDVFFVVAGGCMNPCRTKNFAALGLIESAALSACMSLAEIVLIPLLRGTGVSLKSIEGLARGSLILSTTIGMRGLDVEDGIHCRIEDDLSRFPDRIVEMLADRDSSERMREAARRLGDKFDFRQLMALYVPGAAAAKLVEAAEEFAARRRHAIEELLPRLSNTRNISPVLADWKQQYLGQDLAPEAEPCESALVNSDSRFDLQEVEFAAEAFDSEWYVAAYPDVAMLGMDPAEHYAWIGRALGRAPNRGDRKRVAPSDRLPPFVAPALPRANGSRRWFLADPSLVNNSGHSARYLLSIAAPLRERGDAVHILGNHRLRSNAADLVGCEAAFTLRCEEAPLMPDVDPTSRSGLARLQQRRTELLCGDLDRLVKTHAIGRSDVLLINSLRHWSLEGVVEWLERMGPARAPTVALVLHYTPHPQPGVLDPAARVYQDVFRRIARSRLGSRILLCTDSERLRAEYRSLYDVPITVLPVPHCNEPVAELQLGKDSFSIVFAGEARSDKGFHLLAPAIREVLAKASTPNVVFDIQAYGAQGAEREVARIDLPAHDAVRVRPEPLSEAEYESLIEDADLVLIPYLRGPYQAQTSGVYCEAAALGIPVVVPSGTWMADHIAETGGGVLFQPGDALSLANSCLDAIDNYDRLRQMATQAAPAWRAFHNPRNFIASLDALLEGLPTAQAA